MKVNLTQKLLKEFIYEGIMDLQTTTLTKEIVRDALKVFFPRKPFPKGAFLTSKVLKKKLPMPGLAKPINVIVELTPTEEADKPEAVSASWQAWKPTPKGNKKLDPTLTVSVNVPLLAGSLDKTQIPDFILSVKQFVRHELEHARQTVRAMNSGEKDVSALKTHFGQTQFDQDNNTPDWNSSLENAYAYLTEPAEIEAHVMQAYKLAKHQKIPFIRAINSLGGSYIDSLGKAFGRAQAALMVRKAKELWMEYAKKRLPHLFNTST